MKFIVAAVALIISVTLISRLVSQDITSASEVDDLLFLAWEDSSVAIKRPGCNVNQPESVKFIVRTQLGRVAADKNKIESLLAKATLGVRQETPQFLDACTSFEKCGFRRCNIEMPFETWHRGQKIAVGDVQVFADGSLFPNITFRSFEVVQKPEPDDEITKAVKDKEKLIKLIETSDNKQKAQAHYLLGFLEAKDSPEQKSHWEIASKLGHRGASWRLYVYSPLANTLSGARFTIANGGNIPKGVLFDGKPKQKEQFERALQQQIGPVVAYSSTLKVYGAELDGDRIVPIAGLNPSKSDITALLRQRFNKVMGRSDARGEALRRAMTGGIISRLRCDKNWCRQKNGPVEMLISLFASEDPNCKRVRKGEFSCKTISQIRIRVNSGNQFANQFVQNTANKAAQRDRFIVSGIVRREGYGWKWVGTLSLQSLATGGAKFSLRE